MDTDNTDFYDLHGFKYVFIIYLHSTYDLNRRLQNLKNIFFTI